MYFRTVARRVHNRRFYILLLLQLMPPLTGRAQTLTAVPCAARTERLAVIASVLFCPQTGRLSAFSLGEDDRKIG